MSKFFKNISNNVVKATTSINYTRLSDFQDPYLYLGYAFVGTNISSPNWFITRLTINLDGSVITQTASNVAWSNRYSVIYT